MHLTLEEIREQGEKIRTFMKGKFPELALDNSTATVEWIEGYISRNRHVFSEERRYGWAISFGYLIGESIIEVYGGEWSHDERTDTWGIKIPNFGWANPIGKADKFLMSETDSVLSFFQIIRVAIEKGGIDKLNS
jgi:hypothetical protein